MSPIATSALPLLPLDAGVVLPGMTITLALETPEARAAAEAASGAGNRLVLVPRLGRSGGPDASSGRYARVGTVAQVERVGRPSGWHPGRRRAGPGAGHHRRGHGDRRSRPVGQRRDRRGAAGRRRTRRGIGPSAAGHLRGHRRAPGHGRLGDLLRGVDRSRPAGRHGRLLAGAVGRAQGRAARDRRSRPAGSSWSLAWGREALAELELKDRIRSDVAEGMERTQREYLLRQQLAAIRKELGETRRGRRTVTTTAPAWRL